MTPQQLQRAYPDEVIIQQGLVHLTRLGLTLKSGQHPHLLSGYCHARLLPGRFRTKNDHLLATIHGITCNIQTQEELFILKEIFHDTNYAFHTLNQVNVIDIGMNVGFASLYFANHSQVKNVFGYEPFKPTYQQALRNFQLNPELAQKIIPFNVGLSNQNQKLTVDYAPQFRGQASVRGLRRIRSTIKESQKEPIQLAQIGDALRIPGPLVLKIDCEGSEYDIVPALVRSSHIHKVERILIEWHEHGPQSLVKVLQPFFNIVTLNQGRTGILFGVRAGKQSKVLQHQEKHKA